MNWKSSNEYLAREQWTRKTHFLASAPATPAKVIETNLWYVKCFGVASRSIKVFFHSFSTRVLFSSCDIRIYIFAFTRLSHVNRSSGDSLPAAFWMSFLGFLSILTKRSQIKVEGWDAMCANNTRGDLQAGCRFDSDRRFYGRFMSSVRSVCEAELTREYLDAIICWEAEPHAACWAGWSVIDSSWAPSPVRSRGVSPKSGGKEKWNVNQCATFPHQH